MKLFFDLLASRNFLVATLLFSFALINTEAISSENDRTSVRLASISEGVTSIYGVWDGGDTATMSIYGTMIITPARVSWKPVNNNPACSTSYSVKKEISGVVFKDQADRKYMTTSEKNQQYSTFLLELNPCSCLESKKYLRFTTAADKRLFGYLAYIAYRDGAQAVEGYGHFFRSY